MSARDVIADHRIGYPGAPGGLLLGSVHADAILASLHDAGCAVVPATDPEVVCDTLVCIRGRDADLDPLLAQLAARRRTRTEAH